MKIRDIPSGFDKNNMLVLDREEVEELLEDFNNSEFYLNVYAFCDGHIFQANTEPTLYDIIIIEGVLQINYKNFCYTLNLHRIKEFYVYTHYKEITIEMALTEREDYIDLTFAM